MRASSWTRLTAMGIESLFGCGLLILHRLGKSETDARGGVTMIRPGEPEATSAGRNLAQGIAWWSYRCLENPRPRGGTLTNGKRLLSISG
jgi:hypothetical protein